MLHCYIVQSLRGGGGWRWRSEESAKLGGRPGGGGCVVASVYRWSPPCTYSEHWTLWSDGGGALLPLRRDHHLRVRQLGQRLQLLPHQLQEQAQLPPHHQLRRAGQKSCVDSRIAGCRFVDTMFMFQDDRLMKPEKSRGDQTVEIILATTALVTVIALFLRFAPAPPLSMSMLI